MAAAGIEPAQDFNGLPGSRSRVTLACASVRECPLTDVARVADLVAAGDSAVHADDPAGHEVAFDDIDHGASDLGGVPGRWSGTTMPSSGSWCDPRTGAPSAVRFSALTAC